MSDEGGAARDISAGGDERRFVTLGHVSGAYGVRGWVKVHSETSPRDNILGYSPWYLTRGAVREVWQVSGGRQQGKAFVAKLAGCDDRDAAEALVGAAISIPRDQLPATTEPGEFYWADLVGLRVVTLGGVDLGRIVRLFETGANDVIVVQGDRERLVPYLWGRVVCTVDLEAGVMWVDWDPAF